MSEVHGSTSSRKQEENRAWSSSFRRLVRSFGPKSKLKRELHTGRVVTGGGLGWPIFKLQPTRVFANLKQVRINLDDPLRSNEDEAKF